MFADNVINVWLPDNVISVGLPDNIDLVLNACSDYPALSPRQYHRQHDIIKSDYSITYVHQLVLLSWPYVPWLLRALRVFDKGL